MNQLIINPWCKQCGLCAAFCPKKVFDFLPGAVPVAARPEVCVGCKICQWRCPDFAIEVKTEGDKA